MNEELKSYLLRYEKSQIFVLWDSKILCDLPYETLTLEVSEENKSLATAERIFAWLTEHSATRKSLLINVGGGCLCDIGGFVAATYMRGIDYINVPTTLLAMVDAAIGGKTGVNFKGLKNYIGAFRMPKAVIINTDFLKTLPPEELMSGFGEVLKTALLIGGKTLNQVLLTLDHERYVNDTSTMSELIVACKQYKESIVAQDPEEKNIRKVLNFGHTVGHAIEETSILTYRSEAVSLPAAKQSMHGFCVAWGIVAELYLSVVALGCPKELLSQVSHLVIEHFGKPQCNCKQESELITLMRKDKKNADSKGINFTLLRKAGEPVINQVVEEKLIKEAIEYLFSL